jgi:hypothetical protein
MTNQNLNPQANFADGALTNGNGTINITASLPLLLNNNNLSIYDASLSSSGTVNITNQSFNGTKTFNNIPKSLGTTTTSTDLATKSYVDNLFSYGQSWEQEVISFWDFSTGNPSPLVNGNRYISSSNYGSFVLNQIYTYQNSTWIETVCLNGFCVFVMGGSSYAGQCILYNGTIWVNIGASITYANIYGIPNQNLNTSNNVSFNGIISTSTNDTSSSSTGSLQVNGGLGLSKGLLVGTNATISGNEVISGTLSVSNATSLYNTLYVSSTTTMIGSCTMIGGFSVGNATVSSNCNINGSLITGATTITSTNDTTSLTTGGLICNGGLGIAKSLFVNSNSTIGGTLNVGSTTINGILNTGLTTIIDTSDTSNQSTGALVVNGGVGINKSLYVNSNSTIGGTLSVGSNATINGTLYNNTISKSSGSGITLNSGSELFINDTTDTSNTSTGALQVHGGVGIGKKLYVSSNATIGGTLNVSSNATVSGTFNVGSDTMLSGNTVNVGTLTTGQIQCTNTDNSSSTNTTTGSLIIGGGCSINGNSQLTASSSGGLNPIIYLSNSNGTPINNTNGSGSIIINKATATNGIDYNTILTGFNISGTSSSYATYSGSYYNKSGNILSGCLGVINQNPTITYGGISTTDNSTSNSTGSLVVNGGVGITNNLFIGTSEYINGTTYSSNLSSGALIVSGGASIQKNLNIGDNSQSTNTLSGGLYVVGGVGIGKNIFVGGNINSVSGTASTSISTGALVISGGAGISNNLYVGGNTNINGSINMPTSTSTISIAGPYLKGYNTGSYGYMELWMGGGTGNPVLRCGNTSGSNAYDGFFLNNLSVSGTLTKGGGSFLIDHPDPGKPNWKLRHCFVETPSRGDNIYRYQIQTNNLIYVLQLPNYFKFLNESPQVFVSSDNLLGYGFGKVDVNLQNVNISVSIDGIYNVLIIATRKDKLMKDYWDTYGAEIPPE